MPEFESPYFAAIDLGSNSFHMIISRLNDGTLETIDKVKEMVQIARGMSNDQLAPNAQQRAIDCLQRFSERIREIPPSQVRAVGTKSLRSAKNATQFLQLAEQTLGHPIAIISGFEEARLVYSGLSHCVTNDNNRRLVIDVGGASTELIIGRDENPALLESLNMGCVSFTERFLTKSIDTQTMKRAYFMACNEIELIRYNYFAAGWNIVYGTSGTMRAVADLLAATDGGAIIRRESLFELYNSVANDAKKTLQDVPKLRGYVLPGGIAILKALFEQLHIETIHVADATLKDGLIFDTIGRTLDSDARITSVAKLQRQYNVDVDQANRVARCARALWHKISGPTLPGVSRTKILIWAAQLHEVGLGISHSSHHHHSFYILSHSDLAGFGRYEQRILATLVRAHRKKLGAQRFEGLNLAECNALYPMILCLRVSIILYRRREELGITPQLSQTDDQNYALSFPMGWLADNPLTTATLEQENRYFANLGISLTITESEHP